MEKQGRSNQRKEQRDTNKRFKQFLEDEEIDRLLEESEAQVTSVPSCNSVLTISEPFSSELECRLLPQEISEGEGQDDTGIVSTTDCLQGDPDDSNDRQDEDSDLIHDASNQLPGLSAHEDLDVHHSNEEWPHTEPNSNLQAPVSALDTSQNAAGNPEQFDCNLTELSELLDEIGKAEAKPDTPLRNKLAAWTIKNNVVHRHVDSLLQILRTEGHPDLPMYCRSLLKTPKKIKDLIRPLGAGVFWYQGVLAGMQPYLCEEHVDGDTVRIDVYADGASPYKSVKVHLWPLTGRIVGSDPPILFIIAVWCGSTKDPQDVSGYLRDFVREAKELIRGFFWNGRVIKLRIRRYVADAPARAFLKCVVAHNSYGACERCSLYGQWCGRVIFPASAGADLRTDLSFTTRVHAAYHKGESPLEELGTGMITQFPLDGMHLLYLGVMKKLLKELLNEKKPGNHKISDNKKDELSSYLISFIPYCPSEFSRKPRTLHDWNLFKAHEFRRILLYDGVLLFSELPTIVRDNFLLLHCAARILSDETKKEYIDDADYLLKKFVAHAGSRNLYGPAFLVYNVHHLEHFAEDCKEHGTADDFSAFLNENFIGALRDMLNAPGRTLAQIIARVLEKASQPQEPRSKPPAFELHGRHTSGPLLDLQGQQFQKLFVRGTVFRTTLNDSCCAMKNDDIMEIQNFVKAQDGQVWVVGKPYDLKEDIYTYPMKSSLLGEYKVSRLLRENKWKIEDLNHKCMRLPILKNNTDTESFCCIPMLQHFEL